jgi:glycosyltransferase involved in cell wall biosynthesis
MKVHLVTIAITNYNYETYIIDAINSALNQTYVNCEVMVYDDNSTDRSVTKIQQTFGNRIRLIKGEKNRGRGYASNFLINAAKGKYIFFLDGDDTMRPNAIKVLADKINDNDVVFGCCSSFYNSGKKSSRHKYINLAIDQLRKKFSYYTMAQIMPACNKLISLAFIKNNNVHFTKENRVMTDALFAYLLALSRPKCTFVDEVIMDIRHHETHLSKIDSDYKIIEILKVTNELIEYSKNFTFYSQIRLNGNNLVNFITSRDQDVYRRLIKHKNILSFSTRVIIFIKLMIQKKTLKYFSIVC